MKSNQELNDLDFYFLTNSDITGRKHEDIGLFHIEVLKERDTHLVKSEPEKAEKKTLVSIKEGKDECLIRLASKIKNNGGNGILDLTISYSLIGINGDHIQITAMGMGILLE